LHHLARGDDLLRGAVDLLEEVEDASLGRTFFPNESIVFPSENQTG
jgi:hypothetical protein